MSESYEPKSFPERDWKHLRAVHGRALERYCARVIEECKEALADADAPAHDRYLRIFRLLKDRDRSLAWAFDDMRRSRAFERLAALIALGVVTAEELEGFSPGVRESATVSRTPTPIQIDAPAPIVGQTVSMLLNAAPVNRR